MLSPKLSSVIVEIWTGISSFSPHCVYAQKDCLYSRVIMSAEWNFPCSHRWSVLIQTRQPLKKTNKSGTRFKLPHCSQVTGWLVSRRLTLRFDSSRSTSAKSEHFRAGWVFSRVDGRFASEKAPEKSAECCKNRFEIERNCFMPTYNRQQVVLSNKRTFHFR